MKNLMVIEHNIQDIVIKYYIDKLVAVRCSPEPAKGIQKAFQKYCLERPVYVKGS